MGPWGLTKADSGFVGLGGDRDFMFLGSTQEKLMLGGEHFEQQDLFEAFPPAWIDSVEGLLAGQDFSSPLGTLESTGPLRVA